MEKKSEHSIQTAAWRTGLSPHLIRIWERRYQAVTPGRSRTNRRFYSEEDIHRLRLLKQLSDGGRRIGSIAKLSLPELRELSESLQVSPHATQFPMDQASVEELTDACSRAIENLDAVELERCLDRASVGLAPLTIIENLLVPLLIRIGERWRKGELRIVHGQFSAAMIRPFLVGIGRSYSLEENSPRMVTATPEGQQHEFGALFASSAAAASGWRAVYLGNNLPAEEIAAGVHQLAVKVVGLSLVYPKNDSSLQQEMLQLRRFLAPEVKIVVGGNGAGAYLRALEMIGAVRVANLTEFQEVLDGFAAEGPHPYEDAE